MAMHLVRRNTRSVPWVAKETLAPVGEQDSTDHDVGLRTSKSSSPSEGLDSRILKGYCGAKGSGDSGPSDTKPTPRSKKCPRTNEGNPDCQNVLLRMTLSSAGQNHR